MVRQVKYPNNIVEQDHRAIKRVARPMLNFKSFQAARSVLAGVEFIHMIRKASSRPLVLSARRLPSNFMRWRDRLVQHKLSAFRSSKNLIPAR